MYLTNQEERMSDGEYGWANQVAMKILTRLGDLFGATKLIPVSSAHISGVSYKHLGEAAIDFLGELAKKDGRAKTQATLNP
jgi:predicted aconitase